MKYWKIAVSGIFALAVFLFWMFPYRSGLAYQEQLQMFLWDCNYFTERISLPGGLGDYLAEMLVQFYFHLFAGAAIIALLLTAMQRMTWAMARRSGAGDGSYVLSFVPAMLTLLAMGNENVLLSFVVCLNMALAVALLADRRHNLLKVILIPIFYWLFGVAVYIMVTIWGIRGLDRKDAGKSRPAIWAAVYVAVCIFSILIAAQWLQYPLYRQFSSLNYFRHPMALPYMMIAAMAATALWWRLMPVTGTKTWRLMPAVHATVLTAGFIAALPYCYLPQTYELTDYDYLVRRNDWNGIIEKAQKKQPDTPMGVCAVNLALYNRGELSDRLFEFYQNGTEGLFPTFRRDYTSPLITSEVFFQMGMINTAQRYVFEAQEAIPNHRMSARMTRRLAETNLINGQYAVAEKYLCLLEKTTFYRQWAKATRALLGNEQAVNSHPRYGAMRAMRFTKDFLFSEAELDQMAGLLFTHNYDNRMAYEYLICYELLNRNLPLFMKYYPLGQYAGFNHIPRAYQEALVYCWSQQHKSFQGMPWSIDRTVAQNFMDFARLFSQNSDDPAVTQGYLANTFWTYYFGVKNGK